MRIRSQDANGDMTFGRSSGNFLVNSIAAVAQNVQTTLLLKQGEWFLDVTAGTPWTTQILGYGTQGLYDLAIQETVLSVPGVTGITAYSSTFDPVKRALSVTLTITTQFDTATISAVL